MKVAVLGAGIAGLAAGWRLQALGHRPTVWESSDAPGGKIQSLRRGDYLLELGPHSIMASHAPLYKALEELGLATARLEAGPESKNRFIYHQGKPVPIPMGPAALLRTPLLTGRAKWRLLKEPFIAGREADESVAAFFERRLGPEVVTRLIDPFISGVYAGDPEKLSTASAFPALKELEKLGGSMVRGALARRMQARRNGSPRPPRRRGMYSFREGLQEIPRALAGALGDNLCLNSPVVELAQAAGKWLVNGELFDGVVSTLPVTAWGALAPDLYPPPEVSYTPVAVVHLSYPREAVRARTDGFGLLIPAVERRRVLGILFDSSLFPHRAPEGEHLFTLFMGGERNRWIERESQDGLIKIAKDEAGFLLEIQPGTAPLFRHIHLWDAAIPQYGFGHGGFVRGLDALEASRPSWAFAGNYRQGISVGQAFSSGIDAAQRLADRLVAA